MVPLDPMVASELDRALQARARGQEGRARVCARRAAGLAVRAYLIRIGENPGNVNGYDLLLKLSQKADLQPKIQELIQHLVMRVDEAYQLPLQVDLLADALHLIQILEN